MRAGVRRCIGGTDGKPLAVGGELHARWQRERRGERDVDGEHADDTSEAALRAAIQDAVDGANAAVSRAESIRAFTIVPEDFTEENGLLTPSLKLRRARIHEHYAAAIDALYSRSERPR